MVHDLQPTGSTGNGSAFRLLFNQDELKRRWAWEHLVRLFFFNFSIRFNSVIMDYLFLALLVIVAFLYSSVGHGGASGYLALMALFGLEPLIMRSSALTLNLFVAGTSFIAFYRGGFLKWKLIIPFVIASVPMAYLGAQTVVDPKIYKIILGVFLIIAVGRMLYRPKTYQVSRENNVVLSLIIGALLGFFSGMIGIGGGIILSPLVILLHWANAKEAAAASALFILLNSAAGLFGLYQAGFRPDPQIFIWVAFAFTGGLAGAWTGSFKFSTLRLQYLLAGVLLVASIKLFFT